LKYPCNQDRGCRKTQPPKYLKPKDTGAAKKHAASVFITMKISNENCFSAFALDYSSTGRRSTTTIEAATRARSP
jgi:hypothetical protein